MERIGRTVYPLRVFGFALLSICVLLSQLKTDTPFDSWTVISIALCLAYPHLAFLNYKRHESRETEMRHMLIDMVLIGLLTGLVSFNPIIALPFIIANSAANYALRGMQLMLKGLALAFAAILFVGIFRDPHIVLEISPIELLLPFTYLTIITHFMGHIAYVRGMSLIRRRKLAEEVAQLDFLTGLYNRRYMFDHIKVHETDPQTRDINSAVIMADVDYFKQVNDNFGHDHGDAVLIEASALIKKCVSNNDIVARWGGEEFLILLPNTDITQALSVAENIRERIANSSISFNGEEHTVTLTLGVASYTPHSDFEHALKQADSALYRGKARGRNRVVTLENTHTKAIA